jgi:solute carrier family 25 folate transporter 32
VFCSVTLSPISSEAIAGFAAGFVTTATLYPLDVLKVKFQAGQLRSGFWRGLTTSGRRELYRGFLTGLASSSLSWCQYFYLYAYVKDFFRQSLQVDRLNPAQTMFASFLTGCAVQATLCPVWVVKVNLQLAVFSSFFQGISVLWTKEGVKGLYRGLVPGLWSCLHAAVQFAVYEEAQERLNVNRDASLTLLSTVLSKTTATLATSPLEVIKTRVRNANSGERSFWGAAKQVHAEQGLVGFYRGMAPALARILPAQCLMFLTYEQTKKLLASS